MMRIISLVLWFTLAASAFGQAVVEADLGASRAASSTAPAKELGKSIGGVAGGLEKALCGAIAAPQQAPPQTPPSAQDQSMMPTIFRGGVEVVQAPVLVLARDGNYVNGLQPPQFHL